MKKGDRVIVSAEGAPVLNRKRGPLGGTSLIGTIIGYCRHPNCVRVHWDGNSKSCVQAISTKFLALADSSPEEPAK